MVGAGAAGLMAATWAGRTRRCRVLALDGASRLGAKLLLSGGGRCNVTHDVVDEARFNGSTPAAIRRVLRRFGVGDAVAFFAGLGVDLVHEEGGKLFPRSGRARSVLEALLRAAGDAGVEVRHPFRVETIARTGAGFALTGPSGTVEARRVVLATGGRSLPATGSDGHGFELARGLGHTTTPVFPALVPLLLPPGHPLTTLAGLSHQVAVEVRSRGRRQVRLEGALLCTHFGVSGPAVLDASRHWVEAHAGDPAAELLVDWLPALAEADLAAALRALGTLSPGRWLAGRMPERLARRLCETAGVVPSAPGHSLTRDGRHALLRTLKALPLPVRGDRGFAHAEVTAGGVPLAELRLDTLESRACPGLHLCGEMLDVDGRIGGFNLQWAWASGHVAGVGAARSPGSPPVV